MRLIAPQDYSAFIRRESLESYVVYTKLLIFSLYTILHNINLFSYIP
jgi:hypothetical protein